MGNCFITRRGSIQQGFFPSLFVTGLSEQDTCTATCNGKSFVGEWVTKTVESEEKALIPTMTSNNAPSGYIASGDSTAGTSYAYYLAFDNNISTRWSSSSFGGNKYLQIQLPSAKCVRTIKIKPFLSSDGNTIKDYKIQASNDGSIWVDLHSGTLANGTGNTSGATSEETIEFGNDANYLYYRFYILTSNSTNAYPSIWDIQFYGTEEIEATGFYFPRLTELGTYTVSDGTSTMEILIDAPIEYTLEWSTIPRNGLVAEYLFDGDTLDTSPNGNDLTNSGITFSNNTGVFSGSAYAQASSGVIPTNSPLSISFWIKESMTTISNFLNSATTTSHNGIHFTTRTDGKIAFAIQDGTNDNYLYSSKALNDGSWHNIIVTWSGDTTSNGAKMYIDGIADGTMTVEKALTSNTYNLSIGKPNNLEQYYLNGSLDNIRIYNRVLTEDEIEALYGEAPMRTYLYKEGDECTDLTGGWSASGYTYSGYTLTSGTKNTDNLYVSGTGSGKGTILGTNNSVDLTNYTRLFVECLTPTNNNNDLQIRLSTSKAVEPYVNCFFGSTTTRKVVACDISSVSGSNYISLLSVNSTSRNATVYNVWLEN